MPLFGNKFAPKRVPVRRSSNMNIDRQTLTEKDLINDNSLQVKIGDSESIFQDGHWESGKGTVDNKSNESEKLRKRVQNIKEQSNILRLKIDILIDMLARTKLEQKIPLQRKEKLKTGKMKQEKKNKNEHK